IRRTSRLEYLHEAIPANVIAEMKAAASSPCQLHVLTDAAPTNAVRRLVALATAESFSNADYVEELYGWMRFSRSDKRWYRDGLNAECMGWNRVEEVVIRQMLKPVMVRMLAKLGATKLFFGNIDQQAPYAPALCLLTAKDATPAGRIESGRNLQRLWLRAAAHGMATHPLSAAIDNGKS